MEENDFVTNLKEYIKTNQQLLFTFHMKIEANESNLRSQLIQSIIVYVDFVLDRKLNQQEWFKFISYYFAESKTKMIKENDQYFVVVNEMNKLSLIKGLELQMLDTLAETSHNLFNKLNSYFAIERDRCERVLCPPITKLK